MRKLNFGISGLLLATLLVALILASYLYVRSFLEASVRVEVQPISIVGSASPSELFGMLTPPISKRGQFLKVPGSPSQYIWLVAVVGNGQKELNVLIENDGAKIRLRFWWLNSDQRLWCMDVDLSDRDWNLIVAKLKENHVESLPNIVPDVTHGMAYWIKTELNGVSHEACAYCLFMIDELSLLPEDERFARHWIEIVDELLELRVGLSQHIRPVKFDREGRVDWEAIVEQDIDLKRAFDW